MISKGRDENTCSQEEEMGNSKKLVHHKNYQPEHNYNSQTKIHSSTPHMTTQRAERILGGGFYTTAEQKEECLRPQASTEPKMF